MKTSLKPTNMTTLKRLVIYCVSFFIVFFAGIAIDLACGPEPDPYDYYVTFFHNNLQKNDGYQPFYFSGYTFFNGYTDDVDQDNKTMENLITTREWQYYLGRRVNQADIKRVFYYLNKETDSAYFWSYKENRHKFPDSLKSNTFLKALIRNKNAMAYFVMAKKNEPLVNLSASDQWDASQQKKDKQHTAALSFLDLGIKSRDRFLKVRYYYQAQRLFHYGRYFKEASDVYDLYIKNFGSNSHVKDWALMLKAGEEYQFGHKEQSAYLYAKVFELCPERRVRAYADFIDTKVPTNKLIALTKDNIGKAFIYGIAGFRTPGVSLTALKTVYNTDPRSELLSVLLAREINKVEEQYLTPRFNGRNYYDSIGFWDHDKYDSVKSIYVNYIPKLKVFCDRLASEGKYPEPTLGYLGSAYLSWITGDSNAGLTTLSQINDNIRGKLSDQKQLIKLLLLSQNIKKMDTLAENQLLPSLMWLNKKVKQEASLKVDINRSWDYYDLKYYSASSRDFYSKVLARMYLKQRDTAMAALCILRSEQTILSSDRWEKDPGLGFDMPYFWQTALHSYHLKRILGWYRSPKKTAYLKLLMTEFNQATVTKISSIGKSPYHLETTTTNPEKTTVPAIYDLWGTAYLREHKYREAIKAFSKIPLKKLNHSPSGMFDSPSRYAAPFADQLNDYPYHYKSAVDNKLTFAKKMSYLQKQIRTNPKNAASCYYKMANGLYNTSYYGNAWYYKAYSWTVDDIDKKEKPLYYDNDYLREITTEKYYLTARQLSNDDEFKARCTFMAAKCHQKQIIIPSDYGKYLTGRKYDFDESTVSTKKYNAAVRHNPYFKTLQQEYSKTAFYKTAIQDCSYFRDFIKGK
jgi:hypothetical protein